MHLGGSDPSYASSSPPALLAARGGIHPTRSLSRLFFLVDVGTGCIRIFSDLFSAGFRETIPF